MSAADLFLVDKGGPGSGPQGGRHPKELLSKESQDQAISEIKNQLQTVSNMTGGQGSQAFVLQHGEPFYMNAKTFDGPRMTEKLCYMNATQTAMHDSKMSYVEGYVHIGPLAIQHAWNVDEHNNVVDHTLKAGGGRVSVQGYFGVKIGNDYLMKTMVATKVYGVISHTNPGLFKGNVNFKKYSDDQPRDDHGRWSGGGGSDSAKSQEERIHNILVRSDANPKVQAAEQRVASTIDSRQAPGVLDASGHYTPEAHAENQRIAEKFLNPKAKSDNPKAVILLGKPGAGKTSIVDKISLPEVTHINSDLVKEAIPGYTPQTAASYHERSVDIARQYITPQAMREGHNVVFDMTDNKERLEGTVSGLKSLGYKVGVIHANVDSATSAERVHERFLRTDRYVPVRVALSYGERPREAFQAVKGQVHQWREYDTSGRSPKTGSSGGGGVFR